MSSSVIASLRYPPSIHHSSFRDKPKSDLTQSELKQLEQDDLLHGPLNLLTNALHSRTLILISCRNNRKLLARLKAFDRHQNMVLENVREIWTERGRRGRGVKRARASNRERFIGKMFLRGDSVIMIVFTSTVAEE